MKGVKEKPTLPGGRGPRSEQTYPVQSTRAPEVGFEPRPSGRRLFDLEHNVMLPQMLHVCEPRTKNDPVG